MSPLVSIIVPCFNAAPWLAETLASALAQDHPAIEVVVVDDGSTDGSLALARQFERRGVRVHAQSNRGASAARNTGLNLAQGEFIQFLDADDLLTPDKISGQVSLLQNRGRDAVASCRWGRFTTDARTAQLVDDAVFRDLTAWEYLCLHTAEAKMMHPAAWLVPRAMAEKAGPWDERLTLNDDGEYFCRVVLAARGIVFSAQGASLYRSGLAGSLSRRRSRPALESVALSIELIAGHVKGGIDSPDVNRALADYWQRLVYDLYPDAPDLCARADAQVRRLGGSQLQPECGGRERRLAKWIGWKLARRLQRRLIRAQPLST